MLFNLPNGKTINIPPAMILGLTDEEFDNEINDLMSKNLGFETNDCWEQSVLRDGEIKHKKIEEDTIDDSIIPLLDSDEFLDNSFFFEED